MLGSLLAEEVFAYFLVFARIGAAFLLLPGFSSQFFNPRARLLLAIAVSLVVTPVVAPSLPAMPTQVIDMFLMLGAEVLIGLFIGSLGAIIVATLEIAGMMISFQSGLANATLFNPLLSSQASLIGTFLFLAGVLLIFVTDLHHMMILALVDSFSAMSPGRLPPGEDMADGVARRLGDSFALGFKLAAPFFAIGLLFNTVLGILARLMPQLMVFFLGLPVNIMLMMFALSIALPVMMAVFMSDFSASFQNLAQPGGG